jgi:hypothetical protein
MSFKPQLNAPAFAAVTKMLREQGHTVFSPSEGDVEQGIDPYLQSGDPKQLEAQGFSRRKALKTDLSWICDHADCVVHLPQWEKSYGVGAEHALAVALDIPCTYISDEELQQLLK